MNFIILFNKNSVEQYPYFHVNRIFCIKVKTLGLYHDILQVVTSINNGSLEMIIINLIKYIFFKIFFSA